MYIFGVDMPLVEIILLVAVVLIVFVFLFFITISCVALIKTVV